MDLSTDLRDRCEIIDLLAEFAACLDEKRFDDVPSVFTETGGLVFPGGSIRGPEELRTRTAADLTRYILTQHTVSNHRVTLNGERATLRAEAIGTHLIEEGQPSRIAMVGGGYVCELVRTDDGWKFETISPRYKWFLGEPLQH